jgi:hypothetical protein
MHIFDHISPQFFLEWEMLQTNVVEKNRTHILCSITFFFKSCLLRSNVEKHCIDGQATYDSTTRRMPFACCIPKATNTHSEYVILFYFCIAKVVERTRINVTLYYSSSLGPLILCYCAFSHATANVTRSFVSPIDWDFDYQINVFFSQNWDVFRAQEIRIRRDWNSTHKETSFGSITNLRVRRL